MLDSHTCGIDCVVTTYPGNVTLHRLYTVLPTARGGWDTQRMAPSVTRREYRASGQDETRECRVWAAAPERALAWRPRPRLEYRATLAYAADAARIAAIRAAQPSVCGAL